MVAMEKLFHFESPRERYKCDAAIVWCFDNRFEMVLRKLVRRLDLNYYDPIRIAGGTKCLASPEHERDREFVLEQIRISMRLHETKTVLLMLHTDCGAYGGLAAFSGNAEAEAQNHLAELRRAAALLTSKIPELKVRCCFVNFEGVWEVGSEGAAAKIA